MKKFLLKTLLFSASIFSTSVIHANMPPEGFERFFNYYFVETGTFNGAGIRFAQRAKFPEIFSIELIESTYLNAKNTFKSSDNVHLFLGDSGEIIYSVIKDLNRPITFWLDGHIGDPRPGTKHTPLFEELEQIKNHHIKHHTILIDDMHCCDGILFDFHTKEEIIDKVREINPDYEIAYVDGGDDAEYKDNIMVAYIPFSKWKK